MKIEASGVFTRLHALLSIGAALLLSASTAFGQAATTTDKDKDVVQMEPYNVTGSYIPYAADAPAVPIRIISADDIQRSGFNTNVMDILRTQAPQFVGSANIGSNNANTASNWTNGGSMISLRSEPTLVLINGRRVAYAPVGAQTGFTFVDVDAIPASAIERIEILTDGASATYGSDAVSGVVNLILKRNFQGYEVGAGYKFAPSGGHWTERNAYALAGFTKGKTSLTVSLEWIKTDPLFQKDRPFCEDMTSMTSNVPGAVMLPSTRQWYYAVPGMTLPAGTHMSAEELVSAGYFTGPYPSVWAGIADTFNLASYVTLLASKQRTAATVALEHEISPQLQLFGDVLLSEFKTYSQLAGQPISSLPADAANTGVFSGVFSASAEHPRNPFNEAAAPRARFVDHPRGYATTNKAIRLLVGLKGVLDDNWRWETALNYNFIRQKQNQSGVIDRYKLTTAVNSGIVNFFAREQEPGALEDSGIFGVAWAKNKSSLTTWDARMYGTVGELPAGPVQVAFGAEIRQESLDGTVDPGSFINHDPNSPYNDMPVLWNGALGGDPFKAHRAVAAAFIQVRVPITSAKQKIPGLHTMELDLAGRFEYYSDTDNSFVPKFLLRYLPFDNQFAIRASYSHAFNVPALYDLSAPGSVGFTSQLTGIQRHGGGTFGGDQGNQGDRSNPDLGPEKSKSYNVGIVYSPKFAKGLELEASYFQIRRTGLIGSEFTTAQIVQDVELKGTDSFYAKEVHFGGFNGTPITGPGQISADFDAHGGSFTNMYITMRSYNIEKTMQDGVDLNARYNFDTKSIGTFGVAVAATWINRFMVPGQGNVVGTTQYGFGSYGTIPRWHGNIFAKWQHKGWHADMFVKYVPSVTDVYEDWYAEKVDRFASLDLAGGYTFQKGRLKGLTVRVGVNNIFNRMSPIAWTWDDCYSDVGFYGCKGRVFHMSASYKF